MVHFLFYAFISSCCLVQEMPTASFSAQYVELGLNVESVRRRFGLGLRWESLCDYLCNCSYNHLTAYSDDTSGVKYRKKIHTTPGNRAPSEMALAQALMQNRFVMLQIHIFPFCFKEGKSNSWYCHEAASLKDRGVETSVSLTMLIEAYGPVNHTCNQRLVKYIAVGWTL